MSICGGSHSESRWFMLWIQQWSNCVWRSWRASTMTPSASASATPTGKNDRRWGMSLRAFCLFLPRVAPFLVNAISDQRLVSSNIFVQRTFLPYGRVVAAFATTPRERQTKHALRHLYYDSMSILPIKYLLWAVTINSKLALLIQLFLILSVGIGGSSVKGGMFGGQGRAWCTLMIQNSRDLNSLV